MTNKEAVRTLKANYPDACFEQLREAVDAAIKALETLVKSDVNDEDRTEDDQISRAAAIDAFKPYADYESNRTNADWVRRIELVLHDLPSAQPETHDKRTETHACDCIERQAAIDVLEERLQANGYTNVALVSELNRSIGYLRRLPSAQPERSSEIQDILDYLDTVLHPIISPEHWNVYSELHDMISTLPSAQPEPHWIPCSERLPEEDGDYLVTFQLIYTFPVEVCAFFDGRWDKCGYDRVLAWMPLPEPYREEGN